MVTVIVIVSLITLQIPMWMYGIKQYKKECAEYQKFMKQ